MERGFTLIELLVVVLIIGILASIALPQYKKAVVKSRFAEAITNLKAIAQADVVCRLGSAGSGCKINELDIEIPGEVVENTCGRPAVETKNLYYWSSDNCGGMTSAAALYKEEDVCVCVERGTGTILLEQDDLCRPNPASFNYAKLLNLQEGACACC